MKGRPRTRYLFIKNWWLSQSSLTTFGFHPEDAKNGTEAPWVSTWDLRMFYGERQPPDGRSYHTPHTSRSKPYRSACEAGPYCIHDNSQHPFMKPSLVTKKCAVLAYLHLPIKVLCDLLKHRALHDARTAPPDYSDITLYVTPEIG